MREQRAGCDARRPPTSRGCLRRAAILLLLLPWLLWPHAAAALVRHQTLTFAYDAQGHRTKTTESLTIAGFPALTRDYQQTYQPGGAPSLTSFKDVFGTAETTAQTIYDARGMPLRVDLARTGEALQPIAAQTRNVAGRVTQTFTEQPSGSGMTRLSSAWTYDTLGRPLSQTVMGNGQVAKQQLSYWGTGDVKQLIHTLGASNTKTFDFTFDARHQLTGIAGGTAYTGTYQFGDPASATRS